MRRYLQGTATQSILGAPAGKSVRQSHGRTWLNFRAALICGPVHHNWGEDATNIEHIELYIAQPLVNEAMGHCHSPKISYTSLMRWLRLWVENTLWRISWRGRENNHVYKGPLENEQTHTPTQQSPKSSQ